MRIMGIDPGIALAGFGIIDKHGNRLAPVQYGSVETEAGTPHDIRLRQVYDAICGLIDRYKPDALAVEKLYFNRNVTTAFAVSEARGVIILAAAQRGIPVSEYTPMQVKQGIVGYGKAEKRQVQEMTRMFLNLPAIPKPDDTADALAVAVCHAHSAVLLNRLNGVNRT